MVERATVNRKAIGSIPIRNAWRGIVGIAQTVERDLYTVKATGSMPVLNMIQLKEHPVLW